MARLHGEGHVGTVLDEPIAVALIQALEKGQGSQHLRDQDVLAVLNWAEDTIANRATLNLVVAGMACITVEKGELIFRKPTWKDEPSQAVVEAERIFAEQRRKSGFIVRKSGETKKEGK